MQDKGSSALATSRPIPTVGSGNDVGDGDDSEQQPAMRVIPPLTKSANDRRVVQLLQRLDRLLHESSTRKKFLAMIEERGDESGVRIIQGGRLEVFCRAQGKPSAAFDWLCKTLLLEAEAEPKEAGNSVSSHVSPCRIDGTPVLLKEKGTVEDTNEGIASSLSTYQTANDIKTAILDYAVRQARRDPRIGRIHKSSSKRHRQQHYLFDNFSLIVNYGKVKAQPIHIDLQAPNHQFGLVVTDQVPATVEYQAAYHIETAADLQRAWPDLPDTLQQALAQRASATALLRDFGDLLCPTIRPVLPNTNSSNSNGNSDSASLQLCRTGTLLSLPGSVMHAGPEWNGFRAVLFFSGWPGGSDDCTDDSTVQGNGKEDDDAGVATGMEQAPATETATTTPLLEESERSTATTDTTDTKTATTPIVPPYNPDTQYWKALLISDLTSSVWDAAFNDADRIYLLTKLADALESPNGNGRDLYWHLSDPSMQKFAKNIELQLYRGKRHHFIAKFVTKTGARLQPIGVGFYNDKGQFLEKVSVDNLVTEWDGQCCAVHVYRHASIPVAAAGTKRAASEIDSTASFPVCIYYPADESWEGTVEDKPYSLTMSVLSPQTRGQSNGGTEAVAFDGSNGVLRDCDGEEIRCEIAGRKQDKTNPDGANQSAS